MTKENNSEQANKRTSINKSNNSFVFISRTGKPVNRSYADKCCLVHTEYAYSVKKKKTDRFYQAAAALNRALGRFCGWMSLSSHTVNCEMIKIAVHSSDPKGHHFDCVLQFVNHETLTYDAIININIYRRTILDQIEVIHTHKTR